ncbi:MAG TPA: polymer-forming cytoskeletal protein [Steroidobacteraceae bacterium]|jgi:cytoskeletal protein CcmA (bactofilin family)
MADAPKRRIIDQFGASPTFLAEGTSLEGNLETRGPLVVCGKVRGDARVGGSISIAKDAEWDGDIEARQAIIAGRVTGEIRIAEKLEIGSSAVITGKVTARSIAIANGAVIDSDVNVTSGQPVVKFEEKRQP